MGLPQETGGTPGLVGEVCGGLACWFAGPPRPRGEEAESDPPAGRTEAPEKLSPSWVTQEPRRARLSRLGKAGLTAFNFVL